MKQAKPLEEAASADLRNSWAAMMRAARRARLVAAQTGTAIVVMRNGTLEHIYPAAPSQIQEEPAPYGPQS